MTLATLACPAQPTQHALPSLHQAPVAHPHQQGPECHCEETCDYLSVRGTKIETDEKIQYCHSDPYQPPLTLIWTPHASTNAGDRSRFKIADQLHGTVLRVGPHIDQI